MSGEGIHINDVLHFFTASILSKPCSLDDCIKKMIPRFNSGMISVFLATKDSGQPHAPCGKLTTPSKTNLASDKVSKEPLIGRGRSEKPGYLNEPAKWNHYLPYAWNEND